MPNRKPTILATGWGATTSGGTQVYRNTGHPASCSVKKNNDSTQIHPRP